MKNLRHDVVLGLSMVGLSLAFYICHYFIFRDAHHIVLYLIGDLMVIGTFFSQIGSELLGLLIPRDMRSEELRTTLLISPEWTTPRFSEARKAVRRHRSDFLIRPAVRTNPFDPRASVTVS